MKYKERHLKFVGYRLQHDMYSGMSIEPVDVAEIHYWYRRRHNQPKMILVPEETYNEYRQIEGDRNELQAVLEKVYFTK